MNEVQSLIKISMKKCVGHRIKADLFSGEEPDRLMESAIGACMAYVPIFIIVRPSGDAEIENDSWVRLSMGSYW